jgi:hypothetical protein
MASKSPNQYRTAWNLLITATPFYYIEFGSVHITSNISMGILHAINNSNIMQDFTILSINCLSFFLLIINFLYVRNRDIRFQSVFQLVVHHIIYTGWGSNSRFLTYARALRGEFLDTMLLNKQKRKKILERWIHCIKIERWIHKINML